MDIKLPLGAFIGFATPEELKPDPPPIEPDTFTKTDRELLNNLASAFIFWAKQQAQQKQVTSD